MGVSEERGHIRRRKEGLNRRRKKSYRTCDAVLTLHLNEVYKQLMNLPEKTKHRSYKS